jgi:hypothetical protein
MLAGKMPAALREDLVLDLQRVGAGALEQPDGAHHVQRIAEAGVGIDHQRPGKSLADRRHVLGELGQRDEPDVGDAEIGVGDARAGHIGDGKPQIRDHARGERVAHAGQQHGCAGAQHVAEFTGRHAAWHRGVPFLCGGWLAHYRR